MSKHSLTQPVSQEVAQAIIRGERDYADTLQNMELVRTTDNDRARTLNAANKTEFVDEDF